jgi:hypothetical protein
MKQYDRYKSGVYSLQGIWQCEMCILFTDEVSLSAASEKSRVECVSQKTVFLNYLHVNMIDNIDMDVLQI